MKNPLFLASVMLLGLALVVILVWKLGVEPSPVSVASAAQTPPAETSVDESREHATDLAVPVAKLESSTSDSNVARASVEKPATPIKLTGRVTCLFGLDNSLPPLEIKFSAGGKTWTVPVSEQREYSVGDIPSGRVRVTIAASGYVTLAEVHDIPSAPLEQRLNFALEPLDMLIVNIVAPNGQPLLSAVRPDEPSEALPQIEIVATKDPPGAEMQLVEEPMFADHTTGQSILEFTGGNWNDWSSYSRIVRWTEPAPQYLSACRSSRVLGTAPVHAGMKVVNIAVPLDALRASGGAAHFSIIDPADGAPIDDARAKLEPLNKDPMYRTAEPSRLVPDSGLPHVGGDATLRHLDPGAYRLILSAPGREQTRQYVRIVPGGVTELGTYRLARIAVVKGAVLDDRGPVPGANVQLLARSISSQGDSISESCFADSKGRFEFQRAGARKYLVRATSKQGVSPSLPIDPSYGEPHDFVLRMKPGVPTTIRLDAELQAANSSGSQYMIRLTDERGFPWIDSSLPREGSTQLLLAPGSYSLVTRYLRSRIVEQPFTVAESPTEVTITR
jgi:hypothetical protein